MWTAKMGDPDKRLHYRVALGRPRWPSISAVLVCDPASETSGPALFRELDG